MAVAALILTIFVFNILEVGGARFYLENADSSDADLKSLFFAFRDPNYSSMVTIMLLKQLKIILWSLLFVIPGFIKSYEYMLVPYILAEHPDMDHKEVFAESRRLMKGAKWSAFILNLSFIGWSLLSSLTFQLSGIFWSNPYLYATRVEMYRWLQVIHENEDEVLFDAKYTDIKDYLAEDQTETEE